MVYSNFCMYATELCRHFANTNSFVIVLILYKRFNVFKIVLHPILHITI